MKRSKALVLALVSCSYLATLTGCEWEALQDTQTPLQGAWRGACQADEALRGGPSFPHSRVTMTFDGTLRTMEIEYFDNSQCSGTAAGRAKIHQSIALAETRLDLTMISASLEAVSQARVNFNKSEKICGVTEWKSAEPQTVTGVNCEPVLETILTPPAGTVLYDQAQIVEGRLCLGKSGPSDRDATRPSELRSGEECLSKI